MEFIFRNGFPGYAENTAEWLRSQCLIREDQGCVVRLQLTPVDHKVLEGFSLRIHLG